MLGQLGLEQRELVAAGDAGRAPEVDDDRLAAQASPGRTARRRASSRRSPAPAGRRRRAPAVGAALRTERAGRPSGRRRPRRARARRIGRRGIGSGAAYWSVAVPVMFGWTVHTNVYVAGRQRRDVVDPGLDAVEDLALEDDAPPRVLELDVVRRPGSSLSNAIVNGLSAGPVELVSTKAMSLAWTVTSAAGAPAAARPTPAVRTAGGAATREARRAGDAPAIRRRRRWPRRWRRRPTGGPPPPTIRTVSDGQQARRRRAAAGCCRGGRSCRPRRSWRYSLTRVGQPADQRRDQGDDADREQPAAEHEAEEQQRRPRARRGTAGTTGRACGRRAAARRGRRPAGSGRVGPMSWS